MAVMHDQEMWDHVAIGSYLQRLKVLTAICSMQGRHLTTIERFRAANEARADADEFLSMIKQRNHQMAEEGEPTQ